MKKYPNSNNISKIILIYTILFVFSTIIHLRLSNYAEDDAYIHIRIVDHMLRYSQPYFNLGESVLASSSSGWTLFLTVFFWIIPPLSPQLISIINSFFLCVGSLLVFILIRILSENKYGKSTYIMGSFLYFSILLQSSVSLMEIPLTFLLLLIAIYLNIHLQTTID